MSYTITRVDGRLSVNETQATEILKPEKPKFSKTEFVGGEVQE